MICADTSFLFSFYGSDVNTPAAQSQVRISHSPLHVHVVNSFEFENAVRLRFFQGKLTSVERDQIITGYRGDVKSGRVIQMSLSMPDVFDEAARFSAAHTETLGTRAYDILQVAAALVVGATEFWSFDGKQRALAQAEGLKVGP
jgi:predicted nucleic acid-binding protein